MEITIERIREAYNMTGARPIAGEYHTFDGTHHACCALSVLYLEQFGAEALERALVSWMEGDAYDPAPTLTHDLEISPDYAKGVIDGFDGNARYEEYVVEKVDDAAPYHNGYLLGEQARTVFIEAQHMLTAEG